MGGGEVGSVNADMRYAPAHCLRHHAKNSIRFTICQPMEGCSKSDIYNIVKNRYQIVYLVCVQQQQMEMIVLFLVNKTKCEHPRSSTVDVLHPVLS